MNGFLCRLIGCSSIFGYWFRWPYQLCGWAAERRAVKEDIFTWDPSPLIPLDEVDYIVDDENLVALRRH